MLLHDHELFFRYFRMSPMRYEHLLEQMGHTPIPILPNKYQNANNTNEVEEKKVFKAERTAVQLRRMEYSLGIGDRGSSSGGTNSQHHHRSSKEDNNSINNNSNLIFQYYYYNQVLKIQNWWRDTLLKLFYIVRIQANVRALLQRYKFQSFLIKLDEVLTNWEYFESIINRNIRKIIIRKMYKYYSDLKFYSNPTTLYYIVRIQRKSRKFIRLKKQQNKILRIISFETKIKLVYSKSYLNFCSVFFQKYFLMYSLIKMQEEKIRKIQKLEKFTNIIVNSMGFSRFKKSLNKYIKNKAVYSMVSTSSSFAYDNLLVYTMNKLKNNTNNNTTNTNNPNNNGLQKKYSLKIVYLINQKFLNINNLRLLNKYFNILKDSTITNTNTNTNNITNLTNTITETLTKDITDNIN